MSKYDCCYSCDIRNIDVEKVPCARDIERCPPPPPKLKRPEIRKVFESHLPFGL